MEQFDPSLGRILSTPALVLAADGSVEEVISAADLAQLLSAYNGTTVSVKDIADAQFDMRDRSTLSVSLRGREYIVDTVQPAVMRAHEAFSAAALYSPDGQWACFLKGDDLWIRNLAGVQERPLTRDGQPGWAYARQPDTFRSPAPVGLWSPDSKWFLTHRLDERSVPTSSFVQHSPAGGERPVLHSFKYPVPGDPLPIVTYVAIHIETGRAVCIDGFTTEATVASPFLMRRAWFSWNGRAAWFVRTDRHYKEAELVHIDLMTGTARVVVREVVPSGYLDLHPQIIGTPNVRTLDSSNEVVWFSDRDGWGHLYLYDADTGVLKNRITQGPWIVRDLIAVEESRREVVFLASGLDPDVDPARRSLCAISLDGSNFRVLQRCAGDVFVPAVEPSGLDQSRPSQPSYASPGLSPEGRYVIIRQGSVEQGNATELLDLLTRRAVPIASSRPVQSEIAPRHFQVMAADGVTPIHGVMFLPADFQETRHYPLIDYIYPGPQVTQKPQTFRSANATAALALAEIGFVTIMLDTRGIPGRNRALRQAGYGELLEPQLADHAAAIQQLCERHAFLDGDRVGMIGYSAGGAATARALFDYGDLFKVGVSICGSHDATQLSAFMSDKYRGYAEPREWTTQANGAAAHQLRGSLLLMSSDVDQNVHLSQTLRLVDALVRANKDFDLLIIPNEGHDMLLTSGYVQRRVWDYFVRHLLGEHPLTDFEIKYEAHEIARFEQMAWREQRQL
jgi:dipeptidyl-peptidase-4